MGIHRGDTGLYVTVEEDGHLYLFNIKKLPTTFMIDLWNWVTSPELFEPPLLNDSFLSTNSELVATKI